MLIARRSFVLAVVSRMFPQERPFSTDVEVVTLFATVQDRSGAIVTNLKREDFLLEDNGVAQNIRYFSRESDLPLTIGLLIDTSRSQANVLDRERRASYTFLEQILREGKDRAFVAHFDRQVEILQDLTSSRTELKSAFDKIRITRAGTLLYQAIRQCVGQEMRSQQGRKAFLLLSDGVDVGSKTTLSTAIESAQGADTLIYSILFARWPWLAYSPTSAALYAVYRAHGKSVLERLARETGGAFFEVSKHYPIEHVYAAIQEQLRNQYSIGYTPEPKNVGRQFREIRLTTRRQGRSVQTRAGYYTNETSNER